MGWLLKVLRVSHATPDLLSDYLDQRLSPAERQRVDAHIQTCWECRRELQGLQETVYLLRNTPVVPAPRSFVLTASLVAPQSSVSLYLMGVRAAVAVAVALVIVVVGDGLGVLGPSQPQVPVFSALEEPAPVIRSSESGPVAAVPLGSGAEEPSQPTTTVAPAAEPQTAEAGVGAEIGDATSSGGPFELWLWEMGLLALLGALVVAALMLRPRKQSD